MFTSLSAIAPISLNSMNEILHHIGQLLGYEARIAILGAVLSGTIAYFLARKYGDIAGAQAAIKFEKERDIEAHKTALRALLNQVRVAKGLARQNMFLKSPNVRQAQPVMKMPVTAFETAFLIGKESLLATNYYDYSESGNSTQGGFDNISAYLSEAYAINTLTDLYMALIRGLSSAEETTREDAIRRLKERSEKVLEILDRLEDQLKNDLETGR